MMVCKKSKGTLKAGSLVTFPNLALRMAIKMMTGAENTEMKEAGLNLV